MGVNGIYGLSGSGLDIESMVKVGMLSKQSEYDKMQQKFTQNEWTKAEYLELYGSIQTFNNSTLSQYKLSSNMNARSAYSSNSDALSATANATASNMTHYVEVENLAGAAYLIGAHGDNGVKSHNKGNTDSISLSAALFSEIGTGSQATKTVDNIVKTYNKISADGVEYDPDAIAFQFAVGDGVNSGVISSNENVATVSASADAKNGTHTVTVDSMDSSVELKSSPIAHVVHYDSTGVTDSKVTENLADIAFKLNPESTASDETLTFANLNYTTMYDDYDAEDYSDVVNAPSTFTTIANDEETLKNTAALAFTISDGENSAEISFSYWDIMNGATVSDLRDKINNAGLKITAEYEDGDTFTLKNPDTGADSKISIAVAADTDDNHVGTNTAAFLNSLGLTNTATGEIHNNYAAGETVEDTGGTVTMTIDGETVTVDGNTVTVDGVTYTAVGVGALTVTVDQKIVSVTYQQLLNGYTFNDLASDVNALGSNVRAAYDSVQDSFSFYNSESGSKNGVVLSMAANTDEDTVGDRTAEFFTNLGLQSTSRGVVDENFSSTFHAGETKTLKGEDASVKIDGVSYELDSNKITVGGVIYNFTQQTTAPVTVTVAQDTDKIVDKVKSFVEDYNKLLASLYEKYTQKPSSGYTPLTDSQRAEMTDEQIEKWEKKAKEGLLYHDSTLGRIIDKMRDAVSGRIEGLDSDYNTIYSLGISTTGTRGQLVLDEEKLRTAIANDPDAVYNVFAKLDADDNVNGTGVAQRLSDVLNSGMKAVRTRAGTSADISEDSDLNNLLRELQTKMSNFKIMMNAFEDKLYKKYDSMESALALLGTQLNYVTSAFSS